MRSFGMMMMMCLFVLVTFTSTWASSSYKRSQDIVASGVKERHENRMWRYLKNELTDDMIKEHEDSVEILIRRYLKHEANRLGRINDKYGRKNRRSLQGNEEKELPYSQRRFQKMLEKAIVKIITGDLSTADIMLLKSLNYSLEDVLAIRERELGRKMKESDIPAVLRGVHRLRAEKLDREMIETGQSLTESSIGRKKISELNSDSLKSGKDSSTVSSKKSKKHHAKADEDFDFEAYNRQAVYDYENAANKMTQQSELDPVSSSMIDYEDHSKDVKQDDLQTDFNRPKESHVVFKIRYDDSEFDSTSDERAKQISKERRASLIRKSHNQNLINSRESRDKNGSFMSSKASSWSASKLSSSGSNTTPGNREEKTFQSSVHVDKRSSLPVVYRLGNFVTNHEEMDKTTTEEGRRMEVTEEDVDERMKNESVDSIKSMKSENDETTDNLDSDNVEVNLMMKNESSDEFRKSGMYEGLEWVEDDVYRVIPSALDALNYDSVDNDVENDTIDDSDENGNQTSDLESRMFYDERNDTGSYQNEDPDDDSQSQLVRTNSSTRMPMNISLSSYQQLALAHRRDQGQKAIEDIKLKVLAMTGRYNLSSSSNQVQRERLTMFSPICSTPRNTDLETWSDPFSMNMYFQLNLTSGDHVVAAKMRIYKLPQSNVTITSNGATVDEEDDEEKKIRISIYFYTKSLKKHRSKKRLMDSVVTALSSQGNHLALDVRQAIRFWRQNLRSSSHTNNSNNNNHGLVIQVEDQDGRPLKPSQYIEQGSCHTSEQNEDDKAYQRIPALFVQACSRYVRVVNGEAVTYVNCSKSLRNDRH